MHTCIEITMPGLFGEVLVVYVPLEMCYEILFILVNVTLFNKSASAFSLLK